MHLIDLASGIEIGPPFQGLDSTFPKHFDSFQFRAEPGTRVQVITDLTLRIMIMAALLFSNGVVVVVAVVVALFSNGVVIVVAEAVVVVFSNGV